MISSLRDHNGWGSQGVAEFDSTVGSAAEASSVPPLLTVLLRRWRAVGLTLLTSLVIAGVYLAVTPKVYRSAASIHVLPAGQSVMGEPQAAGHRSEGFVGSQASILRSTPVLTRAMTNIGRGGMKTFAEVTGDPVIWLQTGNRLNIEVTDKADLISASMDSEYPQEAFRPRLAIQLARMHLATCSMYSKTSCLLQPAPQFLHSQAWTRARRMVRSSGELV